MTKAMEQKVAAKTPAKSVDAIALLKSDHREVEGLFQEFEGLQDGSSAKKGAVVKQICAALVVHAALEEEIFYPALREADVDSDIMDEADVEHAGAKALIAQLQNMKPGDDHYDAKVKVLGEYIKHHVKEEEAEMFKAARATDADLAELGAKMTERKAQLEART